MVGVWEGWGGARDYCPFAMVVGIERLGATGGAKPAPLQKVGGIMRMRNQQSVH